MAVERATSFRSGVEIPDAVPPPEAQAAISEASNKLTEQDTQEALDTIIDHAKGPRTRRHLHAWRSCCGRAQPAVTSCSSRTTNPTIRLKNTSLIAHNQRLGTAARIGDI